MVNIKNNEYISRIIKPTNNNYYKVKLVKK